MTVPAYDTPNTWTEKQTIAAPAGCALEYTGSIDAAGEGGDFYRSAVGVSATGGINPPSRGDSTATDEANGAGGSFFYGNYANFGQFDGKGSIQGAAVFGTLAPNVAYGEAAGFVTTITGNRSGGLVEGVEATVIDGLGTPARAACFVGVMREDNASVAYWSRGAWLTSAGAYRAGEAVYVDGSAGWAYAFRLRNTAGTKDLAVIDGNGNAMFQSIYSLANAALSSTASSSPTGPALPARPAGYWVLPINGVTRKIPYYAS